MNIDILDDSKLLENIKKLVTNESELTLGIIEHLEEIEKRKLYSDLKYKNLFEYCTIELAYSEHQAYRRIYAMKIVSEISVAKKMLRDGAISLSTINLAGKFFKGAEIVDVGTKIKFIQDCKNLSKSVVARKNCKRIKANCYGKRNKKM